jgi:hypothetical protein
MTLRLNGSTSGYTEIDAPAVAGNNSIALPTGNGSAFQILRNGATAGSLEYTDKIVSGTAQNSTSGTSIDFTGIPSWVKRVTVMLRGTSTSGTSRYLVQLGTSSGVITTGYIANVTDSRSTATAAGATSTAGFVVTADNSSAAYLYSGTIFLTIFTGNVWVSSGILGESTGVRSSVSSGDVALSGTLDRVRITTVNGTDTFDAGSINILME